MGTRVQIAASACFVVSGLFVCGLGGALALADPPPPPENPGATHSNEGPGNSVHGSPRLGRGDKTGDGSGEGPKPGSGGDDGKTGENADDGDDGDGKDDDDGKTGEEKPDDEEPEENPGDEADDTEVTITEHPSTLPSSEEPDPPTESPTTDAPLIADATPCQVKGSNGNDCPSSTSTTTTSPPGVPGPGGGGGGGNGGGGLPSGLLGPPQMQIPPHVGVEAPTVVSVAPGLAVAAGELPLAPITLPVIVAPALAPGLGGGGGGPAPANPALPGPPRAVAAQPPAGRDPLPANVGSNAIVPASSYRIGYTEYLRSAGISQVAALAVPGVAGMLVLTAAGGLVGYRQAKAGLAVRTGGTARFVN